MIHPVLHAKIKELVYTPEAFTREDEGDDACPYPVRVFDTMAR